MKIIYFLSFLFLASAAFAQFDVPAVRQSAMCFVDTNSDYSPNNLPQNRWKNLPANQHINIGYNVNATVWCRYQFTNTSKHTQRFGLTFFNNNIDSLICYEPNRIRILGDRTAKEAQFLSYHSFLFELKPKEQTSCLVKLKKTTSFFEFSYGLELKANLVQLSNAKLVIISVFIGVIIILIVLNISLFTITKKVVYIYYILYSICSIVYIMTYSNYAKYTLFPRYLYFSEVHIYASTIWFIILTLLIASFTNLKIHQPNKYAFICNGLIFSSVIIFVSVFCYILNMELLLKICFYLVFSGITVSFFYLLYAVVINVRYDSNASYLMLFTFWPHLFWGHAILLRSFKVIVASFPENLLVFVFLYEALLFGYILTNKYMNTYKENSQLVTDLINEREKTIQVISQTQVRERRSIANLIHDNIGSQLAYIRQLILLKQYNQVNDSMSDLSHDIRMISHQILPKSLDEGALYASLHNQFESRSRSVAIPKIEMYNYNFPEIIVEEWIYDLYLITLELIVNASKHGNAQSILIEFYGYTSYYLIQITDDGIGFETANLPFGFGLENSQKRIQNYNGSFDITSTLNQGTVVQIKLPREVLL
ncbi:MAG: 7TM diverse intracellular signaling domain-containing protein [Flavobacterium sp.]